MIFILDSKFPLGRLVATSNAVARLPPDIVANCIQRHARGDWGELCDEDRAENEQALVSGNRLLSAYSTPDGLTFWIITEWDRSITTVLLPEDY